MAQTEQMGLMGLMEQPGRLKGGLNIAAMLRIGTTSPAQP
jgi:hypothetical protein